MKMKKILFIIATFLPLVACGQTFQTINTGTVANDGTGDKPRIMAQKINSNFTLAKDSLQRHNVRLKALESAAPSSAIGDTIEFSDGSRIFGGGGQIDIQPAAAVTPGNKLSFYTGGGGDTIYINSNNKRVILDASVLELPGYTSVQDSLYLDYIGAGSITGGVYLLLSPTQAIDTGFTSAAAIGMRMKLVPIYDLVADTVNGEMRWWYYNRKGKQWQQSYGVHRNDPIATDEAHTVQIELLTRYIYDLQKQIDAMKPRRKFARRAK